METLIPLELSLRDGTPVVARRLTPDDRAGLAEAYRRLSPEARYQRFWTRTGDVIGTKMLDRLLDLDPHRHLTWGVLDPAREFSGLGVASWWRSVTDPDEAEFSVTVLDGDHGRGIGALLLAVMWLTAFRAGVGHFVAYVQPENRRAIRWMLDCGAKSEWDGYKGVFRWELGNLDPIPETPAAADLAARLAQLGPEILAG